MIDAELRWLELFIRQYKAGQKSLNSFEIEVETDLITEWRELHAKLAQLKTLDIILFSMNRWLASLELALDN